MYKLPDQYDLSVFIDAEVFSINFLINSIVISLRLKDSNTKRIQINGSFRIIKKGTVRYEEEIYPIKEDFGLLAILGKRIRIASTNDSRSEIYFNFEDDISIEIISNEMYETFFILDEDNEFGMIII